MTSSSMVVPVIDVESDNFKELWPSMVLAFKTASFIALDTELSGLGARKALLAGSVEDRYKSISHAACTRSVLSLGIACYKKLDDKAERTYLVQVYNLTLLCAEEYIIEPQSVQFLVQHGFDFNKQYAHGVPYNKGNDKGGDAHGVNMRTLFVELLRANKPLVVHNGLIDMVFLYQCFYAHLPERLGTFTADLSQMFPAGIYDTKYVTEYELRYTASYLEYAYKKCKLDNARCLEAAKDGTSLFLEFCKYTGRLQSYVDYRPCLENQSHDGTLNICTQFSAYGWCPNGSQCPLSHDTDLIIQTDEKTKESKRKKRKRRKKQKGAREVEEDELPMEKRAHLEEMDQGQEVQEAIAMASEPQETIATASQPQETKAMASQPQETIATASEPQETIVETNVDCDNNDPSKTDGAKNGNEAQDSVPDVGRNAQLMSTSPTGAKKKVDGGIHRAGFDAFMTGYIFAFASILKSEASVPQPAVDDCVNKLYLSGKSVPLHVVKSTFSKSSKAHKHKMEQVWGKGFCDNSTVKAAGTA